MAHECLIHKRMKFCSGDVTNGENAMLNFAYFNKFLCFEFISGTKKCDSDYLAFSVTTCDSGPESRVQIPYMANRVTISECDYIVGDYIESRLYLLQ